MNNTVLLVYMALMTALNLIFTRLIAFDLGPYRIAFGPVATIMAGLWLGPVCGGICGFMSDVLGCFIKGYPPNPLITVTAVLWGVFSGLAGRRLTRFTGLTRKGRAFTIASAVAAAGLIGSIGFTTAGLVLILGYNFYAIFPGRVIQTVIMTLLYSVVCCTLYFSPLTVMIRTSLYTEPVGV
ncbi:MAG: folate family ECF transporter S component [Blautia sp.]|nr:folate family ECF transporter S component [Blautia sp.]